MRFHAFAVCLVIAVLTVATPSDARAQGCDCPEAQMLEVMDFRIAERRAKLDFVQAGGLESSSGLSNDPAVLAGELRQMNETRDLLVRDLINCRMQCHGRESGLLTDGTAVTGASSSCRSCNGAGESLSAAEQALQTAQANFTNFRYRHGFDRFDTVAASDFGARLARLREAEAQMQSVTEERDALRQEQLEACARYFDDDQLGSLLQDAGGDDFYDPYRDPRYRYPGVIDVDRESSEYRAARDRVRAQRRENLDLTLWADADVREHFGISEETMEERTLAAMPEALRDRYNEGSSSWDPDDTIDVDTAYQNARDQVMVQLRYRLLRENYRSDEAGFSTSYWDRVWANGRILYQDRSEFGFWDSILFTADEALEYFRSIGVDLGDIDLTEHGECLRQTHRLDVYLEQYFYPTQTVFETTRTRVPGAGGPLWLEYEQLDAIVRNAIRERDAALANLVRCNANYCRPAPENIREFIDEGDGEDLEDMLEEDEDIPYGDDDDGLEGTGPDLSPVAEPEDAEVGNIPADMPGMPEADSRLAELLAARERLIASGGYRTARHACDYEPGNVCDKLGGEQAEICRVWIGQWRSQCEAVTAFSGPPTLQQCVARCEHMADTADLGVRLRDLALEVVSLYDVASPEVIAAQIQTLEELIVSARAEVTVIEAEIEDNPTYVYTNTNTGEVYEHFGTGFDPQPPLELTEVLPGRPTESQAERLAVLRERISEMEAGMDELNTPDPELEDWRQLTQYTWNGGTYRGQTSQGPVSCTAEEARSERDRCTAFCNAQMPTPPGGYGPEPLDICRPTSTIGMLNTPGSRVWLYPPGDPRREPGYGREN